MNYKDNKPIAIVTGASTGLGKHISLKLSQNYFHVMLIARNKKKLLKIKDQIELEGNECTVISADISKPNSIKKISSKLKKDDSVEVLVNNAGIGIFNSIEKISLEEWNSQLDTNLRGSFLITQMAASKMIAAKTGQIIFINSVAGINPYPYSSAYVASKFGLRGFSASIREELREHNIKVISIHPGAIDTPFWDDINVDFPRNEMISAEDVSKTVINAIMSKGNIVHEEIVIRRTGGDF